MAKRLSCTRCSATRCSKGVTKRTVSGRTAPPHADCFMPWAWGPHARPPPPAVPPGWLSLGTGGAGAVGGRRLAPTLWPRGAHRRLQVLRPERSHCYYALSFLLPGPSGFPPALSLCRSASAHCSSMACFAPLSSSCAPQGPRSSPGADDLSRVSPGSRPLVNFPPGDVVGSPQTNNTYINR